MDRLQPESIPISNVARSATISRLADTNFYACFSRGRIRLHADVIVGGTARFKKLCRIPDYAE
jgi:hypothetical protein